MIDTQYETLLAYVLGIGIRKEDRTGTGAFSTFGQQLRYNLRNSFPLITTRAIRFDRVADELLWFISGSTNVNDLPTRTQPWWRPWANESGDLGPIYGAQWRNAGGVDQLANVIKSIKRDPDSRRHVVSAWNVSDLTDMALPPCHALFQFYVSAGALSCQVYQRSADMFLGVPANIASYALLTHMMARECKLGVGELIWVGGDCHVYSNQIDQVDEQLKRDIREFPQLHINPGGQGFFSHRADDFTLTGYYPHPHIPAPIAV